MSKYLDVDWMLSAGAFDGRELGWLGEHAAAGLPGSGSLLLIAALGAFAALAKAVHGAGDGAVDLTGVLP